MASSKTPGIIALDGWLRPYAGAIDERMRRYLSARKKLAGGLPLRDFANAHHYYGFHRTGEGWVFREKAPSANRVCLTGDFNRWNRESHPLTRLPGGDWEIHLKGHDALMPGQRALISVTYGKATFDRVPAYATAEVQDASSGQFAALIDEARYEWRAPGGKKFPHPMYIYECHVGMAQEGEEIGTYVDFADSILPRIKRAGYNTIQLMAIKEHSYYASFGYHVTGFFAPSSWYGRPEELKYLVDTAHGMGMRVLMDLVHSHASSNERDGISNIDGGKLYCGGDHPAWGSKLFDYGNPNTLHFLLSNIKYWMEEYRFDGFRFDGVTSMLYHDHGLGRAFTSYGDYFNGNVNTDAVVYLQLATELMREINPNSVAIAEDMSGMPGMCLPILKGGIGFKYRLNMGVPDYFIKTLKERRDEDWDMGGLWHELTTRRPGEKTVGYAESHDQALVGDKTLIFRLLDAEMYTGMDMATNTPSLDRGMALIKLIRLLTFSLAGDAYLNFMGNEFGHPEWIDFPREGNGWSMKYARRQWSLADNGYLKYSLLAGFDMDMLSLGRRRPSLLSSPPRSLLLDQDRKVIAFEKAGLIFLFGLHPATSLNPITIDGVPDGRYRVLLTTDSSKYGGRGRVDERAEYAVAGGEMRIYLPSRCAIVLEMQK